MELRLELKNVKFVECGDLDEFVAKVYDIEDYEFCVVEECGSDEFKHFNVDGEINSKYGLKKIEQIKKFKNVPTYFNGILFNSLCKDGYIEPGYYVVVT